MAAKGQFYLCQQDLAIAFVLTHMNPVVAAMLSFLRILLKSLLSSHPCVGHSRGAQTPAPYGDLIFSVASNSIRGSSEWNLLHVTGLTPRILRWLLNYLEMCASLASSPTISVKLSFVKMTENNCEILFFPLVLQRT